MNVMIVAGEASGDMHAANLVRELRALEPGVRVFGVGGERLREAGLECVARSEELSVMGLAEVVRDLPRLLSLARRVRRAGIERSPDAAVLVDSPDFNLPLAKHLHRAGIPVVVYVSPQLWAWRQGRVRRIRRDVDRVLCILPFEVDFYAAHKVAAEYVGHPLVDELAPLMGRDVAPDPDAVALLPGSRWHEISTLLPGMLAAVGVLARERPGLKASVIAAPGIDPERLSALVGQFPAGVEIVRRDRHDAVARSCAAVVASGTATLECALLDVPMVVGYRLHRASYWLAKRLVKVPHVALANLVAGRRLAAELVQGDFTPERIAEELRLLIGEGGARQRLGLAEVRARLGEPGASRRAAEAVLAVARRAA